MCIIHHYNASSKRPPNRKTTQRKLNPENNPRERREEKKNTRRAGTLVKEKVMKYGLKLNTKCAARMKRHKGNPKPQKGFGFPQHLRKRGRQTTPTTIPNTTKRREREREKERTKKRDNRHLGIQGSGPKGHQTKQHSNPRDQENQSEYPTSIPEKLNKNQTQNQQSLGGLVTAGWRGPWAALPSWRITPGDRGTEGSEYPPTTGTAPCGAKHDNIPSTETDTPRGEPSSSPAL